MTQDTATAAELTHTKIARAQVEEIRQNTNALVLRIKALEEINENIATELRNAEQILKCYQAADPGGIFMVPVPRPGSFASRMEREIRRYCRFFKEQARTSDDEELIRLGLFLKQRCGTHFDIVAECTVPDHEAEKANTEGRRAAANNGYGYLAMPRVAPSPDKPGPPKTEPAKKTTRNFAEVIRRKLAADPELAAGVAEARAEMEAEQLAYDAAEPPKAESGEVVDDLNDQLMAWHDAPKAPAASEEANWQAEFDRQFNMHLTVDGDLHVRKEKVLDFIRYHFVLPSAPPAAEVGDGIVEAVQKLAYFLDTPEGVDLATVPIRAIEIINEAQARSDQAVKAAIRMRPSLERDLNNGGYSAKLFPGERDQIWRSGRTATEAVLGIAETIAKIQDLSEHQKEVQRELRKP